MIASSRTRMSRTNDVESPSASESMFSFACMSTCNSLIISNATPKCRTTIPPRFSNSRFAPSNSTNAQAPPLSNCHRIRMFGRLSRADSLLIKKATAMDKNTKPIDPSIMRETGGIGEPILVASTANPIATVPANARPPSIRNQIASGFRIVFLPNSTPVCVLPVHTTANVRINPSTVRPKPAASLPSRALTLNFST